MNRLDALIGSLVADAAALGLHWLYDPEQLKALGAVGDVLFRQPDAAVYAGRKGVFVHAGRQAGELSHYGESARIVGTLALGEGYSVAAHQAAFLAAFGPCGHFVGYADRPTKALVARLLVEGEDIPDASGADDDQLPALCVVPGLFATGASGNTVDAAVRVIAVHEETSAAARAVTGTLEALVSGASLATALGHAASEAPGALGERMREALAMDGHRPIEAAETFDRPCHVGQGLPLAWHLLAHAADFETLVRDNIRCGGDSCGRAMVLGAIGGLAFGVPDALVNRLDPSALPPRTPRRSRRGSDSSPRRSA